MNNRDFVSMIVRRFYDSEQAHDSPLAELMREVIFNIEQWDQIMSRRAYRIELKIDFSDDSRHEIMEQLVRQYGRDLLSSAMLVQDGRKPLVALFIDDSFVGTDELSLIEPSENVHTPDEATT